MRGRQLLTALLFIAVTGGCDAAVESIGPDAEPQFARSPNARVHHVSGGGQVDYSSVLPGYGPEIYGFTASIDGAGAVSGQFESHWGKAPGDLRFHMDITCLSVNGNQAWLGGVTTRSNSDAYPAGTEWVWRVADNGEGANAAPDELSYFIPVPAGECVNQYANLGSFAWTEGNVQVK